MEVKGGNILLLVSFVLWVLKMPALSICLTQVGCLWSRLVLELQFPRHHSPLPSSGVQGPEELHVHASNNNSLQECATLLIQKDVEEVPAKMEA